MSARTEKVIAPLENADSGIVRVPYEAITRPLSARHLEGLCDGFISEERLADLLFQRRIQRAGRGVIVCDGRLYDLHEAVKVVGVEHGHKDSYGLTGLVEQLDELLRAGANIGPRSMHLGSVTYQVVRGVIAVARAADTLAG